MEINRLLIRRLGVGNKTEGNMTISTTIGRPIIEGAAKEANRFSFICFLKDYVDQQF